MENHREPTNVPYHTHRSTQMSIRIAFDDTVVDPRPGFPFSPSLGNIVVIKRNSLSERALRLIAAAHISRSSLRHKYCSNKY